MRTIICSLLLAAIVSATNPYRILEEECDAIAHKLYINHLQAGDKFSAIEFQLDSRDTQLTDDSECKSEYIIHAPEGYQLLVTFNKFRLAEKTKTRCQQQYLMIEFGEKKLKKWCGDENDDLEEYRVSTEDELMVTYIRSDLLFERGKYKLDFSVAPVLILDDVNASCPEVEIEVQTDAPQWFHNSTEASNTTFAPVFFKCDSSMCIPHGLRCDGRFHCLDKSDEADCPSKNDIDKEEQDKEKERAKGASTIAYMDDITTAIAATQGGIIYLDRADNHVVDQSKESNTSLILAIVGAVLLLALVSLVALAVFRRRRYTAMSHVTTETHVEGGRGQNAEVFGDDVKLDEAEEPTTKKDNVEMGEGDTNEYERRSPSNRAELDGARRKFLQATIPEEAVV